MDIATFFADLGLFLLKTIIIVGGVGILLIFAIQAGASTRRKITGLEIEKLNDRYKSFRRQMQNQMMGSKKFKSTLKLEKKSEKKQEKLEGKKEADDKPRVYVLDFEGDIKASATDDLREEVTAILTVAKPGDEVVVRLESGGGMVISYGLASSQLARLKDKGVKLTICVDKIAASGGYMMACVADRILAAPFAIVGSIGVIAQVPNLHRVLKKNDVDYREVTAGEFKRTVTIFGEITEPGMAKFKTQIEETHELFKRFILQHRPQVEIAKVATGEHWYGTQATDLKLVDEIRTSDDYLYSLSESRDLYGITHHSKKGLSERFSFGMSTVIHSVANRLLSDANRARFGI